MTKLIPFTFVLAIVAMTTQVNAQEMKVVDNNETTANKPVSVDEIPSLGNATPEMWFYLQEMRRYDDPALARRRRAELTAAARRARLFSQQWYGISNLRPTANAVPMMYRYSAHESNLPYDVHYETFYRQAATPVTGGPRQF
ncbi:hypothetical protein DTL21_11505 [Bremerella cremea]|uniref:Uncharacterized protein n=1 Tax=Blastopirellula marina TaxID=124 RepID=A0A2S8FPQ0_9BACT|nr:MULTISPECIES: hypothetical protein [Pirellulaceae]PQO34159.1 hypothetical protein C5Y83_11500 [Blastopirellula marina]RCS46656.1 hypothetical protein DTL21_11505 [Bremerella cremea]